MSKYEMLERLDRIQDSLTDEQFHKMYRVINSQ